jgi:hypothetical protein
MGGKPKSQPAPAPVEVPKTPIVDQVIVDREAADTMKRRRGRAATILAGAENMGGGAAVDPSAVSAKKLLGE